MAAECATFKVLGLHCPSCALRLEKVLGGAPGVAEACVDFLGASATVRADADVALDPAALCARAEAVGFRLSWVRTV